MAVLGTCHDGAVRHHVRLRVAAPAFRVGVVMVAMVAAE
jgi:hypothetical protein